jgi:hypothetical protein
MIHRFLLPLVAAVLAFAGCADRMEAPLSPAESGPDYSLTSGSIDTNGVLEFAALPDLSRNRHAEKWIRAAEGGSVELNGFRVDIPAGALPYDALVTIDLPEDELLGKHVIAEFGPHAIQFNTPVKISFPLEGVLLTGQAIEVSRWENNAWTPLGGSVSADGKTLSSTTPHFSAYGGTTVTAGG